MRRFVRHFAFAAVSVGCGCALAEDGFTRVADTSSTLIPGEATRFVSFEGEPGDDLPVFPSLDQGYVAFTGRLSAGFGQYGVFSWHNGVISKVADSTTPVPGGSGTFSIFRTPSAHGPDVAFRAFSESNRVEGIYLSSGGSIQKVADPRTALPGGGTFSVASLTPLSGGDVFFQNNAQGLYRFHNGALSLVAGKQTPLPGGAGTFTDFNSNLGGRDGGVAFYARGDNAGRPVAGIYEYTAGSLIRIADTNTPLPGGGGNFLTFSNGLIDSDGSTVAFAANDGSPTQGIYLSTDGVIRKLTMSHVANNQVFSLGVAVGGGHVAYTDNNSIYSDLTGTLQRTIGPGDLLFGKSVVAAGLGPDALSGNQLAFSAVFNDGTSGIYLVPEPSAVGLGASGMIVLLSHWRRPRRSHLLRMSRCRSRGRPENPELRR